jgi:hypothetical protein
MASRIFPGNSVTSFPTTKELVNSFKIENYTSSTQTGSWTIPFGVRKIFVTMIGQGGGEGAVNFTLTDNACCTVSGFYAAGVNGSNTTITVEGTTYTASGGVKGEDSTENIVFTSYDWYYGSSFNALGGGNSHQEDGDGNRFLGSGAIGGRRSATVGIDSTTASLSATSGHNAETADYSINVNPGSTLTYSVPGQGASLDWTHYSAGGGALYITW